MKSKITILFILFLFSTCLTQTVYVPSGHWVYEYLSRLEAQRLLPVVLNNTRPMTRHEIAGYLETVYRLRQQLNNVQQEQLEFLLGEFREELPQQYAEQQRVAGQPMRDKKIFSRLPAILYANNRNLLSLQNGPLRFYWDPVFSRQRLFAGADTLADQERIFNDSNGFVLWGSLGKRIGFYTDVRDTKEWGTRTYGLPWNWNTTMPGLGFVQTSGSHLYHDETRAYVVYHHDFLTIQYGKDSNQWGPGIRGQLALSDYATSYDFLKWQAAGSRFKYTGLWAVLQNYNPDFFYGWHKEKYLAAHRLDFAPFNFIEIGLHETILYSGRKFEPAYLNPVMFFRSAEHYLGDRDNATMGLDIELKLVPQTILYGELFIDDLTTGKLGKGFYGNKYAWLIGAYYVNVLNLANLDFRLEYARIQPYTYSHVHELNTYQHYYSSLGHWLGPNADELYIEFAWRYSRRMNFAAAWQSRRHGANYDDINIGGSMFQPHRVQDPETVTFLDGIRESTRAVTLHADYELLRELYLKLYYGRFWSDTDWLPGERWPGGRSEFQVQMNLNY